MESFMESIKKIMIILSFCFCVCLVCINSEPIKCLIFVSKNVQEGEFVIINKNEYRSFLLNEKSFVLESDTGERYVVYVSDIVYQSYFVNEKIKATFETYADIDTYRNLKIESIVYDLP